MLTRSDRATSRNGLPGCSACRTVALDAGWMNFAPFALLAIALRPNDHGLTAPRISSRRETRIHTDRPLLLKRSPRVNPKGFLCALTREVPRNEVGLQLLGFAARWRGSNAVMHRCRRRTSSDAVTPFLVSPGMVGL